MTTKPQSTTEEKQLEPVSSSADVDRWKRDLVTAGWIAESATAWRAPDSSLWRGPFGAWKELQRRAKANGTDTNWPLCDVLTQLVEWAKHLHDDHDCDCHGWEARSFLIEAAQRYQAEIAQVSSCPASTAPVVEKEWAKLLAKAISTAEPTLMPERDNLTHYVISSEAFATLAQVHRAIAKRLWGAADTAAYQVDDCPKCVGSGEIEIGCAMDHALTASCVECGGTGHATAAPVEHDSCSHWRKGDSDNCVWCGDDLGPTTEMDVNEEAR